MEKEEKEYLSYVKSKIEDKLKQLKISISESTIAESKKFVWENIYEMDLSERTALNFSISVEDAVEESKMNEKSTLIKMLDSPYFGRFDFIFDEDSEDDEGENRYYIGIGGFLLKESYKYIVYDWRAPVSGMYYDYEIGEAQYTAPQGVLTGKITKKRQYKIKNGKLVYMFDSSLKIDDDILQSELSNNASTQMKNIVATIQKEQNRIIRNEGKGDLIVQGAAGSGKTSIALHRMAYLLYKNRGIYKSNNLLIISPNEMFSEYIAGVLPELGEESILEMSFDDIAENELNDIIEFEPRYAQIEYLLENSDDNREYCIRQKSSPKMLELLKEYVEYLEQTLFVPANVVYKECTVLKEDIEKYYGRFVNRELFVKSKMLSEIVIDRLESDFNIKINKVIKKFIENRVTQMHRTTDLIELYNGFLKFKTNSFKAVEKNSILPYEDVYLMVLLKLSLYGVNNFSFVKHLLVDEMQDYTSIQYEIVRKAFKCPKTILGDIAQTVNTSMCINSLENILSLFEGSDFIKLTKSYRSSYEITNFNKAILNITDIQPIERHGEPPSLKKTDANSVINDDLKFLLNKGYETVAVICKTADEAYTIFSIIDSSLNPSLLLPKTPVYKKGIVVTTAYFSKGIEFDAVIIPNVDKLNYCTQMDRQSLYVACTRALHSLTLYYNNEISEFAEHGLRCQRLSKKEI